MISISSLSKSHSGQPLFSDVSFQINAGEKVGLVGANGTGKTSLFRLITGEEKPDTGQVSIHNKAKLAYFSQNVGEMTGKTALQEVIDGDDDIAKLSSKLKFFEEQLVDPELDPEEMNTILERMGVVQTQFEELGGYDLESNAQEILSGLGIDDEDHYKDVGDFSGGWKMRIALAKVLITNPDIILMDEPTNYLDMETILWLEKWLKSFKGCIFMTTHDREFMNSVANKIVEISAGKATTYTGDYDFFLKEKEIRRKQNEAQVSRQKDMLKKEEDFIARFAARASHAAQVQSRVKKLDKIDRVEEIEDEDEMSILLPELPRGGNDVAVVKDLSKLWTDTKGNVNKVFENINLSISRQDKVAVVGVNGAGKSTLLKIIAGEIHPTTGTCKIGPSINAGYFSQYSLEVLNPENTVFDELQSKLSQASDGFIRSLLAAFLFKGDDVFKKIKYLSGGEKSRVVMAWLLTVPHNLLILDEPTNHLDIKSREVLLEALNRYEGTIIFVSHDRFFLNSLSTKVLEIDKGNAYLHPGDYKSYLESSNE